VSAKIQWSVFTKAWKTPLPEMGKFLKGLGFDGVELTVRPKFQVEQDKIETDLPKAARLLGDLGLKIFSIAVWTVDEPVLAACAASGVGIIRLCEYTPPKESYLVQEKKIQERYDALLPLLKKHKVKIGVQNHCDEYVPNMFGVLHLIEKYDPAQIAAVWDPCHCALNGEDPEIAADIIWDRLCMVNLKNSFWKQINGPEAPVSQWQYHWTTGRRGKAPWNRVMAELNKRNYDGVVCLSAEYTDEPNANIYIADDIAFAKSLL
jgi:sugar phosphate isomerase/epimerase